jgi:hypothetical protein
MLIAMSSSSANGQFKARLLSTFGSAAELTLSIDGASVIEASIGGKPLIGCKVEVVFGPDCRAEIVLDEIDSSASVTLAEVKAQPGVELSLRVCLGALWGGE